MTAPSVLVIDDEEAIASFLKDFLEENGFQVRLAHTGKDGIKIALDETPDIILLDVELPDTDGYSVCRQMRERMSLRNKPILMLTVRNDSQNEITGLKAGADDYLTKPVNTSRLLARLNTALHRNIRELDANALTHLPGNTSILQEIEGLLQKSADFSVIYGDLNNFKAFNDHYGFLRGDQAIKMTAQCLLSSVEPLAAGNGAGPAFVGHIGGDDFIMIVPTASAEKVCEDVIARFDHMAPNLYDDGDKKNGYIEAKTRQGVPMKMPLIGIALVIVMQQNGFFNHPAQISARASELKAWAKSFGKSAFVMDRRKSTDRSS